MKMIENQLEKAAMRQEIRRLRSKLSKAYFIGIVLSYFLAVSLCLNVILTYI